ncbi:hypothetical protein D3C71_235130 [compost metagenome]
MSEVVETQETAVSEFKTIGDFIEFLKTVTDVTLDTAYVLENLETIVNTPVQTSVRRGQLSGLNLEEMTDEQLKRELINANSVLYKATQRKASADTIAKNQARVDAAKAEKERREPAKAATDVVDGEAVVTNEGDAPAGDTVVDSTPAAEENHPVEGEL